ncbi:hypothetical protein RRG08_003470 [Elysia crispata]|uniref:Uncharacterized protein n=1 Tax=Elysia crispata TaxID=231223 RepID=A0AAE0Y6V4_9GAST|nr:hypothetical protein RRG08_003470 [Elysia crispata]
MQANTQQFEKDQNFSEQDEHFLKNHAPLRSVHRFLSGLTDVDPSQRQVRGLEEERRQIQRKRRLWDDLDEVDDGRLVDDDDYDDDEEEEEESPYEVTIYTQPLTGESNSENPAWTHHHQLRVCPQNGRSR